MLRTAICDLLGIRHPIIQGGMAHLGTAELVSAVSNAGGLGIIGAGYYHADWVREQILITRTLTDRPFGVNLLLTSPHVAAVIGVILEDEVTIVTTGAGDPLDRIPEFKQAGIKVMPIIGSVARAHRLEEAGVDAIGAEGMESGGHIGGTSTMALVPQVVDSVSLPVVAAGGIADGRGVAAALALGAIGAQLGTRFVCSNECIAHPDYKQMIVEAHDRSTVVTGRGNGLPLRSLKNSLTEQYMALEQAGVGAEELNELGRGRMHLGLIDGDTDEGSLLSGQIAGMIGEIKPVKVIIEELVAEAEAVIGGLRRFRRGD